MADYDEVAEKKILQILTKKAEKIKRRDKQSWSANFGMIASLGGVFIVPILLGVWLGGVLDAEFPQQFSWRLSLIFLGFLWGLANSYMWIRVENKKIERIGSDAEKTDTEMVDSEKVDE